MQLFIRHLLIALSFISCNNFGDNSQFISQDYQDSKLTYDTVKTMPYEVVAKPEIFETAFFYRTETRQRTRKIGFYALNVGNIDIRSGYLIASEPWWMHDEVPFVTKFPVGQFPVQLAIKKNIQNEFVAFSRILFSDEPVDHWEFALKKGQTQISIFGDSIYFYPVDSGIGGFVDDSSYYNLTTQNNASQSLIMDKLSRELDKKKNAPWQSADIKIKNVNIVAFSSGFGDGRYATYIGFDKNNNPCRLLTDFELNDWHTNRP